MESSEKNVRHHPRAKANPISALIYWWTLKIFAKGYKNDLEVKDLYDALEDHRSVTLGDKLESWNYELELVKSGKKESPKLAAALWRIFGLRYMLFGIILIFLECVVKVAQPIFLGRLIMYFSQVEVDSPISREGAYLSAGGVSLCSLLALLLVHPYALGTMHIGMQMRVAVCSLIYRKFLHYLYVGAIQIVITAYLVWLRMQWAGILGLAFIVFIVPLQLFIGKAISKLRLNTANCTDERVRLMNEIIIGIQVIKMYTWEKPFAKLIALARRTEIKHIRRVSYIRGVLISIVMFVTRVTIFISAVSYVLFGNELTAEKVFVTASLFNILRTTMTMMFPQAIAQTAEITVTLRRIQGFLILDEVMEIAQSKQLETGAKGECGVDISKACAKWNPESHEQTLINVDMKLRKGQLVAVIGPVGTGKSSLIHLILGELPLISGTKEVKGMVSYSSQEAWLFTGSVRQNITFGLPYDAVRYKEVVRVCALDRDLEQLPYGDDTIVGERGVSLSGGQRARVNLARAVYKDADIYLLDDPLSAVDAHVGRHLFDDCIKGFLRHKSVLLVTHQLQYLTQAHNILILNNGTVEAQGSYTQLQASGLDFARLLEENEEDSEAEEESGEDEEKDRRTSLEGIFKRITSSRRKTSKQDQPVEKKEAPKAFAEMRTQGAVSSDVYMNYLKAGGNWLTFLIVFGLMFLAQVVGSGADYWLSFWTNWEESYLNEETYSLTTLIVAVIVVSLVRAFLFYAMCMRSSINLHNGMFVAISRATMAFFNNNPSGRILNRFSKDMGGVDELLPSTMIDAIQIGLTILGIFALIAIVNYWLIIPTVLISFIFFFMRVIYISTSRSVKRLEGVTRSPVFTHLNASIQGLTTIRAYQAQEILAKQFDGHQDLHSSAWYLFISTSRSFAFWLDIVCFFYISTVTFSFLFLDTGSADSSDVGLAITQVISITGMFQWGMRQSAELENHMTSVERIMEFSELQSEPPLETSPENEPPKGWPPAGEVKFNNLSLRYSPLDPPVLKKITFTIQAGEKVGIVGRTGAGKTSLISALFRLADCCEGHIYIDGVDTATLGLHQLRGNIAIIPQEPVLFSGTMRKNLDPFDDYSDEVLWKALEEVELQEAVSELPGGLSATISEGGSNFSVGQRQLVCLARAIIRNNRILLLDEATANVDPKTDALIQTTIRRKFAPYTVLTIAHRLHTVMDSDRVLVMEAGQAAELAPPGELLANPNSMLSLLAQQTGSSNVAHLRHRANDSKASHDALSKL
ncbi:hypothetical protein B566_EDAN002530 [Ephemera danica]|nr:hypothetical protein B566_EDAN002530 [Ephemera danica]